MEHSTSHSDSDLNTSASKGPFQHLTVFGTGLIGGSFLMACRSQDDLHIRAVDPHDETLQYLLKAQAADTVSLTFPQEYAPNHLIVLAAHLDTNLELLKKLAPIVAERDDVLITDIGSCKQAICQLGDELLPHHFVGGHPLAGKEFSGVKYATPLLFAGKPYAICPPEHDPTDLRTAHNVERLIDFMNTTLQAKAGTMPRQQHDKAMAYVSHFPQLYATLLTNLLAQNRPGELLGFHGAGMDDQLRLAASPYAMWEHVFEQNRDNLLDVIRQSKALLNEAEAMLSRSLDKVDGAEHQANDAMAEWFEQANTIHREFHQFRHNQFPGDFV